MYLEDFISCIDEDDWLPGRRYNIKNRYYIFGDTVIVELLHGHYAYLDLDDIDLLDNYCFHTVRYRESNIDVTTASVYNNGKRSPPKRMATLVMEKIHGSCNRVKHRDGNRLNNTKFNLYL